MQAPSDSDDPYVLALFEKRAQMAAKMKSVIDGAEARAAKGGRDLTHLEQTMLTEADGQLDHYDREIVRYREVRARLAPGDDLINHINEANRMTTTSADGTQLRDLLIEARAGRSGAFDSAWQFESRALGLTSATFYPTSVADFVTVYQRTNSPMLNPGIVNVLQTASGNPLVLPRVTADSSVGGTVTAENGTITEADPTVSSVTLGAFKYASITNWSNELDTDEVVGLQELIANANARPITIGAGAHLTTGTGTVQPWGIVTRATIGGTASGTATYGASATFFGWGDLALIMFSVAAPVRQRGSFMVSTDAFQKIVQFRDANNNPIFAQGLGGVPDTVLGRPIYENPAMAAVASASKSVLFGDMSQYVTRRVNPLRVTVSPDYKYNLDQTSVRVVDRIDGDLIDVVAVKALVSANT